MLNTIARNLKGIFLSSTPTGNGGSSATKERVEIFPYLLYYKPGIVQYYLLAAISNLLLFGLYKTKFALDDQLGLVLFAVFVAGTFLVLIWANNKGFLKQKIELAQTLHERPTLYMVIAMRFIEDISATVNESGLREKKKVMELMKEIFPEGIAIARTETAMHASAFELLALLPAAEYDRLCQYYIKKYNL